MSSNINYTAIDVTYPIAGVDNNTQGFRDNFMAIKNGLSTASSEISSLQSNTFLISSQITALQTTPASSTAFGTVKIPAVSTSGITNSSGTISLATASATQLGGVKIPAVSTSGITNSSGTISLATASATQLGGVKIDNNSIVINNGVISVGSLNTINVSSGTINGILYLDSNKNAITNSSFLFNGTNLGVDIVPNTWENTLRVIQLSDGSGVYIAGKTTSASGEMLFGTNSYKHANGNWVYRNGLTNASASQYHQINGGHVWNTSLALGTANTTTVTSGKSYTITSTGGTNYTLFGSPDNNLGTTFTANASGTGNGGTVSENINWNPSMTLDVGGHLLIGTTTNTNSSKVVVNGMIETTSGGVKFPDGSVQTTATLLSRTTVTGTTSSIAAGNTANLTISGYKGYVLYSVQTSSSAGGAWVRIYTDVASRTADASRLINTPPTTTGVVTDIITTGNSTIVTAPGIIGFNNETSPTTDIVLAVNNTNASAGTFTITLTLLPLEK